MTWFWFNHFNVHQYKADIRADGRRLRGARRSRPHALGRFRDLLEATLRHPAMLRYLDNADNAAGHINENYAREIMELHTMGVGSGYTQKDVQELARILTGWASTPARHDPKLRAGPCRRPDPRRACSSSIPTGTTTATRSSSATRSRARGFGEVEEALDILARAAGHGAPYLAASWRSTSSPTIRRRPWSSAWPQTFQHTDGDIAEVLATLFRSPEFKRLARPRSSRTRCTTCLGGAAGL